MLGCDLCNILLYVFQLLHCSLAMALDPLPKATEDSRKNLVLGDEGAKLPIPTIALKKIVGPVLGEPDKEE